MRTNILGALLVTSILIFGSAALADHGGDRISIVNGQGECIVTHVDVGTDGGVDVIATEVNAIVRISRLRQLITGKCSFTDPDATGFDDGLPNPTVDFQCEVIGNTFSGTCDGDGKTKKRITKKGKIQLDCECPMPFP